MDAASGPRARARDPIDRKIPREAPLCSLGPKLEASVVRQGTMVADEMAYMKRPVYNCRTEKAEPISRKEGMMRDMP